MTWSREHDRILAEKCEGLHEALYEAVTHV